MPVAGGWDRAGKINSTHLLVTVGRRAGVQGQHKRRLRT